VVRIRSTARLQELEVSEAYLQEVEARSDLAVSGQGREMSFDGDGNLLPAGWRVEKELCA
jgi:hypothetical protein